MSISKVLRCIRPQCMNIHEINSGVIWCDCGAKLEETELEIEDFKNQKVEKSLSKQEQKKSERKPDRVRKTNVSTKVDNPKEHSKAEGLKNASRQPHKASIYLLIDDYDEERFALKTRIVIGRNSGENKVDVDLSKYDAEKKTSRRHAAIEWRQDGYYITKISTSHSLHVNGKALDVNEPVKLNNDDMIVLSRIIAFQFEEEE